MIMTWIFAIFVFALSFMTLFISSYSDKDWFKNAITVIFSAMVSMLVTFNIFR